MHTSDRIIKYTSALIAAPLLVVMLGALKALVLQYLWNYLFGGDTSIIGVQLPALDFYHAWVLCILCDMLFKSNAKSN